MQGKKKRYKEPTPFKDITGKIIHVGDLILRPIHAKLTKHYVLGYSKSSLKLSCRRGFRQFDYTDRTYVYKEVTTNVKGSYVDSYAKLDTHSSTHNLSQIPDIYILEEGVEIPDKLRRFIDVN